MLVETTKKLFSVDDYYKMLDVGILTPEDRVELIDGEIFEMSPKPTALL
jgi:Uma2 family endonuclease